MSSRRWLAVAGVGVLAAVLAVGLMWVQGWALKMGFRRHGTGTPVRTVPLPADGRTHMAMRLSLVGFGRRDWSRVGVNHESVAAIEPMAGDGGKFARLMVNAPVMPGRVTLSILQPSFFHWRTHEVRLEFGASDADSFGDGTPDFLRLHRAEDRKAFRDWFTLMAELLYDNQQRVYDKPDNLPAGVEDCAGLLRYAYREALVRHDDKWFADERAAGLMTVMPPIADVRQYSYPETPLGADLFRVKAGKFSLSDLPRNEDGPQRLKPENNGDDKGMAKAMPLTHARSGSVGSSSGEGGAFAEFADAKTLMELNTYLVGRDIHTALPGDVIFYRQLGQDSPYHSMIVVRDGEGEAVVYDTGPTGRAKGEVRRLRMADLLNHPDARWRPLAGNPNFLGVYRWNILREEE